MLTSTIQREWNGQTLEFRRPSSFSDVAKVRARYEYTKAVWQVTEYLKRLLEVLSAMQEHKAALEASTNPTEDMMLRIREIAEMELQSGNVEESDHQARYDFETAGFDAVMDCLAPEHKDARFTLTHPSALGLMLELRHELFGVGRVQVNAESREVAEAEDSGAGDAEAGRESRAGEPATV